MREKKETIRVTEVHIVREDESPKKEWDFFACISATRISCDYILLIALVP